MVRRRFLRSVAFRLVSAIIIGGLLVSLGLGVLELKRSRAMLQMRMTQHVAMTARNMQNTLARLLERGGQEDVERILRGLTEEAGFEGVRLVLVEPATTIELGSWVRADDQNALWTLGEHGMFTGHEVDLYRLTFVKAPFKHDGAMPMLELLVDGPSARQAMHRQILRDMVGQWLLLSVMMLAGLLLLRRWVTTPLSDVVQLVNAHAGPEPFYRLARQYPGEFGRLGEAIGGMLMRLENTAEQLRKRERAFQNLYQLAPAAMVSLSQSGHIIEANLRAAELMGEPRESKLIRRDVLDLILPEDRMILRQSINRLKLEHNCRCELRLLVGKQTKDVAVECTGVRDDDGTLQSVRLSLSDISESKQLQRQLADKSRLLNLIIDHMSDAILLVDARGRIAACNQQLGSLLHRRTDTLSGEVYHVERFWDQLGVMNEELFLSRLKQIEADQHRPAQERVEARVGTFLFQGIPVQDAGGEPVGRLWVVQEITHQVKSQRLLSQQNNQMQALKRLGHKLCDISGVDHLLSSAAEELFEVLGVEALGIALRDDGRGVRSRQILHRGPGGYLLETNEALVQAVERQLMPLILSNSEVTHWSELPGDPWARSFRGTGLTSLAGAPLIGSADAQGIVWIARRGGERIERNHMYLLEALGPVIAARLEVAHLLEQLHAMNLTDIVTDLPNLQHFQHRVRKLVSEPGTQWGMVTLSVDHFRQINDMVGRDAADRLLRQVGAAVRRVTRKSCFIARLRGAGFGILMPGMHGEAACQLAERVRQAVSEIAVNETMSLTASIGVVHSPGEGVDADALINLAHERMNLAKDQGRNRVISHNPAPADPPIPPLAPAR